MEICPAFNTALTNPESENETDEFQLSWSGISPDFKSVLGGATLVSQEQKRISRKNIIGRYFNF